jgi:hypothetical protein
MTTTIKVISHNYPAKVEVVDRRDERDTRVETRVLFPEDGEQTFYCTTSRELRITDLEYDDPRAVEARVRSAAK